MLKLGGDDETKTNHGLGLAPFPQRRGTLYPFDFFCCEKKMLLFVPRDAFPPDLSLSLFLSTFVKNLVRKQFHQVISVGIDHPQQRQEVVHLLKLEEERVVLEINHPSHHSISSNNIDDFYQIEQVRRHHRGECYCNRYPMIHR